ncbi:activating signal cointegrator 1 complex subunit [Anaeramoeba flamelloides]|uniref:Activating signal cointegrator 1 complex subunit n=1 Tax=Anaeramoeba flamelloides TaxID=1746091 RepID=A0AAV7YA85_9EUKA|nr:activating signal cointegrator 1 complex subunit [Anaeramoeba flamelloides]
MNKKLKSGEEGVKVLEENNQEKLEKLSQLYPITKDHKKNQFIIQMDLPQNFYPHLIGPTKEQLTKLLKKVRKILHQVKSGSRYTHFINLPLISDEMKERVILLQEQIKKVGEEEIEGFKKSVFVPPERFHLTLVMVKLYEEHERDTVKEIISNIKDYPGQILETPLGIEGMETFEGQSFEQLSVLYAKVKNQNSIEKIHKFHKWLCLQLQKKHILYNPEPLELHATLVNVRYLQKQNPNAPNYLDFTPFNRLNEKLENYKFPQTKIKEIHLSTLDKYRSDGFYFPLRIFSAGNEK